MCSMVALRCKRGSYFNKARLLVDRCDKLPFTSGESREARCRSLQSCRAALRIASVPRAEGSETLGGQNVSLQRAGAIERPLRVPLATESSRKTVTKSQ